VSPAKKALLSLGATLALLVILEGLSSVALSCTGRRIAKARPEPHQRLEVVNVFQFDTELGWRYRPSAHSPDHYGKGLPMTTNARGMRALREHTDAVPEGKYRIVCVGDSFTMGWGVADDETFPHFMEELNPSVEAINMGCGAYGAQQCYLWYKQDGLAFDTDVLLLCLIDDDFRRMAPGDGSAGAAPRPHVDMYEGELRIQRAGTKRHAVEKPGALERFVKDLSVYRLLLSFARDSIKRRPVREASFVPASEEMFRDLARISRERGQEFYLVYLPSLWELPDQSRVLETWLRDFLQAEGIGLIDLSEPFSRLTPSQQRSLYLPDGHFSVHGTRAAAEGILEALATRDEDYPAD